MKAQIVRQKSVSLQGAARHVDHLVITSENLVITPHRYEATGVRVDEEVRNGEVLAEIEVSDELVRAAMAVIIAMEELDKLIGQGPSELQELTQQLM